MSSLPAPSFEPAVILPATKGHPVVSAEGLRKSYGSVVAIDGVSVTVRPGEIVGLVGPNGAGKTTTIECLEGLRRPDAGTISILGEDPWNNRPLRERIGIQLQSARLARRLKVREAVDLFASFYRRTTPRGPLLEQLGLTDKLNSPVIQLSGGQLQRLFVALALINDPDVLFLDELTTGLDPQARHGVWDLIRATRDRGKTIILSSHFMEEVERLCDRVTILDRGRVLASDTPANLIRSSAGGRRVVFATDDALDASVLLTAVPGVTRVEQAAHDTIVHCGADVVGEIVLALERGGCRYRDLRTTNATLEDVFLALTGRRISD